MYTIRILNGDSKPFDIVTDNEGLFPMLSLLNMNPITFFKVSMSGNKVKPEHFGWGSFRGWVEKFAHETECSSFANS